MGIGTDEDLQEPLVISQPRSLAIGSDGNIYYAEATRIRRLTPTGEASTIAGSLNQGFSDSIGHQSRFWSISGITEDVSGDIIATDNNIYLDDNTFAFYFRKITKSGTTLTRTLNNQSYSFTQIADEDDLRQRLSGGLGQNPDEIKERFPYYSSPSGSCIRTDSANTLFSCWNTNALDGAPYSSNVLGVFANGQVDQISNISIYLAGYLLGSQDGPRNSENDAYSIARFQYLSDLEILSTGELLIVDRGNRKLRIIGTDDYVLTYDSQFEDPRALTTDPAGGFLLVDGHSIKRVIDGHQHVLLSTSQSAFSPNGDNVEAPARTPISTNWPPRPLVAA